MASGHANRANRPNTWLHRPTPANVKILLANSEPSTHGTQQPRADCAFRSAFRRGLRGKVGAVSESRDDQSRWLKLARQWRELAEPGDQRNQASAEMASH